jgi:hypothetical protein
LTHRRRPHATSTGEAIMAFTDSQLTSLEAFAAARAERIRSAPVNAEVMARLVDDGTAVLLGDFPGSPVRYVDRWWRIGEAGWEALDDAACEVLDDDAERWAMATAATAADAPGEGSER